MITTHAVTMNGRMHGELKDGRRPVADVIRDRLERLDGKRRYSLIIWPLPDGKTLDDVDVSNLPDIYMQVAGSRERMTLELRRIEDGRPKHYVVGRPVDPAQANTIVRIPWSDYEVKVYENEVFNAEEAAQVFTRYVETDEVDPAMTLRELGTFREQSEA